MSLFMPQYFWFSRSRWAWGFPFLTSSRRMLILLIRRPHFKTSPRQANPPPASPLTRKGKQMYSRSGKANLMFNLMKVIAGPRISVTTSVSLNFPPIQWKRCIGHVSSFSSFQLILWSHGPQAAASKAHSLSNHKDYTSYRWSSFYSRLASRR